MSSKPGHTPPPHTSVELGLKRGVYVTAEACHDQESDPGSQDYEPGSLYLLTRYPHAYIHVA